MQSQMSGGQMPCSPPLAVNSQMPPGPRPPGMPMGPGMGGQVPPMCGQMMGPGGYGAPMPGAPAGYGNQMSAGSNQMMLGTGPAASGGGGGMAPMDGQMGASQNVASHQGVGGPGIPASQPQSAPGMPGPMGGSSGFVHGGPSVPSQMQPNGSSMMVPGASGPMTSIAGSVSGISTSLPVSSPPGGQISTSSSATTSQSTVASTVSNQGVPISPYMSSGSSMASQVPSSSSAGAQVPASGSSMPNQMGGYPAMQPQPSQQHLQPLGSGGMMPAVPNEVNGSQGMLNSSGSMGNGQMGPGGVGGPAGQMTGGPAQSGGGQVPGLGGMNMAPAQMMGSPVSQMQNNMVTGGTLSTGSAGVQPGAGNMPGVRPGAQFMGGPTNSSQMGSGLPSSAAATNQMVGQHPGGTAPRMPNPSNIGPQPGQLQMSGTQQAMPYGYGGSTAPGQAQHQSSAMNMYGWNAGSSGGGGMPQNMMSQGTNVQSVFSSTNRPLTLS